MNDTKAPKMFPVILLLSGSFIFAFLLGEMVHEYGHYISHLAYGNAGVGVVINPFGMSRIVGVSSLPLKVMGVTSAAGPLTDLFLASLIFLLLWPKRNPVLLPLLLWGPVAMIQEGVNFSLGLLTPGGDAQWISTLGIPQSLLATLGIILITGGLLMIAVLLYSLVIPERESPLRVFIIVLAGMCALMVIRFLYTALTTPEFAMENLIPLIFSLLLAVVVVVIRPLVIKWIRRPRPTIAPIPQQAVVTALILGLGMFAFQILYSIYL